MTKPSMALAELAEKGADGDIVHDLLAEVTKVLMDFEVRQRCGTPYGKRDADRTNSRNGYRERRWETRAGTIDLHIPKLRRGSYFPGWKRRYERAPLALA